MGAGQGFWGVSGARGGQIHSVTEAGWSSERHTHTSSRGYRLIARASRWGAARARLITLVRASLSAGVVPAGRPLILLALLGVLLVLRHVPYGTRVEHVAARVSKSPGAGVLSSSRMPEACGVTLGPYGAERAGLQRSRRRRVAGNSDLSAKRNLSSLLARLNSSSRQRCS